MSGPPYQQVFGSGTVPPSQYQYQALSLGINTAFNWPYNYSGTAAVTSTLIDMTATAAGLVFTMPPADAVSTGETVVFNNKGSNTFTIKDNAGNVLATVAAGVAQLFYVTNNLSAAGLWGQFTMGAGTSSATAGALAGLGVVAIGALLNAGYPVVTSAAATYAVHAALRAQVLDLNGGICTVTPDTAATLGNNFYFLLKNSGSGVATFSPSGGNTIDGNATMGFQPGESAIIVCSGSAFFTIGYGRSSVFQFSQLTLDISAGGTFTLTPAQASNKILSFVGNPAAGVNVVVPNVPAVYYVLSNLSTAQSVTIKTAAGSGVAVPQSQRTILICDGVNVTVTQSPLISGGVAISLPDGSAASPSLGFSLETNTGLYRNGAGNLGVSILGTEVAQFMATGMSLVDGAVGTPAYTFFSETNTGFYRNGAGKLGVSILGSEVAEFRAAGLFLNGAATAAGFAPQVSQIQNGGLIWCGVATGTANALVLTPAPAVITNPAGQLFFFQSSAAGNSGATTVAISGLPVIAVQKNGAALVGGEILANKLYGILVDTTAISCQLFPISGWAGAGNNNDIAQLMALTSVSGNPNFSGAPTVATAIVTDQSTKITNMAALWAHGIRPNTITFYSTSQSLTNAQAGGAYSFNGASLTATLPVLSSAQNGDAYLIGNYAAAGSGNALTITAQDASSMIGFGQSGSTSFTIGPGDFVIIIKNGNPNWMVFGSSSIGVGQTWTNVAGSRTAGTTYTNSTGKPIMVVGSSGQSGGTGSTTTGIVNGVTVGTTTIGANFSTSSISMIVPNGATYSFTMTYDAGKTWSELR